MFLLSIKKAFFDAWDNLAALILSNIVIIAIMMLGLWPMFKIFENNRVEGFLILIALIPLISITLGTVSSLMSTLADFRSIMWSDVPTAIKKTWGGSVGLALIVIAASGITVVGMTYYNSLGNLIGIAAAALLFWIMLGVYLASLWFFAVKNRLSGGFFQLLRKSILIMMDNIGLSLFTGLIMVPIQMILWFLTVFMAFGPTGIQLYLNVSLRLLMFKYDWLEEHPDAKKRDIPWYEILIDEHEKVGKRTLKGMIFPWKE